MVFVPNLIKINDLSSLVVQLSSPWSTISCYHNVNFVDLINENSDLPSFCGKRISIFKLKTDNIKTVLKFVAKKFGTRICKQVRIISDEPLPNNNYIKDVESVLQLSALTDNDGRKYSPLGNNFIIKNTLHQLFKYKDKETSHFLDNKDNLFSYLLVLINSKITFIKVTSDDNSELIYEAPFDFNFLLRVSNTLTGTKFLKDVFELMNEEDFNEGGKQTDLPNDTSGGRRNIEGDNIIYYMVQTLLHNLCDVIMLQSDKHNLKNVIIGEYFNNRVFLDTLKGFFERIEPKKFDVYFMRHNGISTAVGALSKDISKQDYYNSWSENYSISSGFTLGREDEQDLIKLYVAFDSYNGKLVPLPLLKNPSSYTPYIQDFTLKYVRDYWIDCAGESVESSIQARVNKDPNGKLNSTWISYLELFKENTKFLKKYPFAFGTTTFMVIQDIIQKIKKELGLHNSYYKIKRNETSAALNFLNEWLHHFDELATEQRHLEISKSLLAGNMFDWGSTEINKLFKSNRLDFSSALSIVPERPWLVDNLDLWLERMQGPPHKFAAIFPDNCGFDFILGIIPFARELIKRGTKIVFCANVEPVLNDVTCNDIKVILEETCNICPIISEAYKSNKILVIEHLRCSPCLDLRYINKELAEVCNEIDLLVIDGMGRSVHTNFYTNISIDCLKVAIIKDKWLSKELGGQNFAAVYNYTKAV